MTPYYVEGGEVGRNDAYGEANLTFDPSEDASPHSRIPPTGFSPFTNDRLTSAPHQLRPRQQSVPVLSPLAINSRAPSPVRGTPRHPLRMPLTGDGRGSVRRQDSSPGRFAGWLTGNSTPATEEPESPTPKSKRGMSTAESTPKSTTSATPQSRFGFFASSVSALTTRLTNQSSASSPQGDELFDLNIETALYPSASPTDRDTFSPAAYKNLQANATGVLLKMQNAYRERTVALQQMQAERSVEQEEAEEASVRVENLKMQLEHMALKAAEQEQSMRQLMGELKAERRARERLMSEGSVMSEDLGVDEEQRKKWRESGSTIKSDVSFDTDEESAEGESVFSRSRSPISMTSATDGHFDLLHTPRGKVAAVHSPTKSKSDKDLTTFQKLMKNMSVTKEEDGAADSCRNCHGQDASVAWDTVSLLRDENKSLKHRVADLEVAVEGALDMVNGIGL